MTNAASRPAGDIERLPECPEFALIVGNTFKQLGGALMIGSDGKRFAMRPEYHPDGLPQMDGARPWEQFHSDAEWQGAMKLANFWLSRLSEQDRELLYAMFASVSTSEGFDFRAQLSR